MGVSYGSGRRKRSIEATAKKRPAKGEVGEEFDGGVLQPDL